MSREQWRRLARRVAVLAMTIAVIAVGISTVGVAARWRAESAPLDTAPVAMSQLEADLTTELGRSSDLTTQIAGVAGQVATVRGALVVAGDTVGGDTENAVALQAKLDAATAKLTRLQRELKAAQRRLAALNDAAARQAALNRAATQQSSSVSTVGAATSGHGEGEGEGDDD